MFVMDSASQLKVDIICKVSEGKISIANAAKLLNKSRRTIERYLSEYGRTGIQFALHKNRGKTPVNKSPDEIKFKVQKLIKKNILPLILLT